MHDHIKYLLYRHNCVILPGFGGIVLQYAPARIHPAQHVFQPPRKALAFNRSLTINDGLLTSHVANTENVHYDEAETRVRKFVEAIENSIRRKGDFAIHGVGRFFNDIEGNLQFVPEESENYLLNAYGLERFVSPAIIRRDAFEPNAAASIAKKKKKKFGWFGLSVVVLVGAYLAVQFLSIHDMTSITAGFDALHPSPKEVKNEKAFPAGRRDTVVQIIVIKDETLKQNLDSITAPSANDFTSPSAIEKEVIDPNKPTMLVNQSEQSAYDTAKIHITSKVPMLGEYNPSERGDYVIIFSNAKDSTHAAYFQQELWKNRIGVRVMTFKKRLIVAKTGYHTPRAASKDLAIYRLLGFDQAYIQKLASN